MEHHIDPLKGTLLRHLYCQSEVDKLCEDSGDWHIGIIFKEPVVIDMSGKKKKKKKKLAPLRLIFFFLSFYSTKNKIQTPPPNLEKTYMI